MVKQHRGAINLAVTHGGTLLLLLPHFAATYFHMQEDKFPGYDKEQQKAKETRKQSTDREKKGVKPSANHYSREGVTTASVAATQRACVVQLLYINGFKASVKMTTSSRGCRSLLFLTGL